MGKGRLEAFSDAVIAIVLTIMVLEMKVPHGAEWGALRPLMPVLTSYALSYAMLGIYWNNHHHLLHATRRISGGVLWANLHLLFWLSLVPFVTGWMGESHFAPVPVAAYGIVMLLAGVSYFILTRALLACHEKDSTLATALGRDFKGWISVILYVVSIPIAFVSAWTAFAVYVAVAIIWLIPDPRIERRLASGS